MTKTFLDLTDDLVVEWFPAINFSSRWGKKPQMIVVHYTGAMEISGTLSWFRQKRSQASAHYVIGRNGRIVKMVKDESKAWHAGASIYQGIKHINNISLGIELVGVKGVEFTSDQYASLVNICAYLCVYHSIQPKDIVGHEHVSGKLAVDMGIRSTPKIDPGPLFDWQLFRTALNMSLDLDTDKNDEQKALVKEVHDNKVDKQIVYEPSLPRQPGKDPSMFECLIGFIIGLFSFRS